MQGNEIFRIDGSGKDSSTGVLTISEILSAVDEEAFRRDWGELTIEVPQQALALLWSVVPALMPRLTRAMVNGKPAVRWQTATRDIELVPVKGKPLITARVNGRLVATADYKGRDPGAPRPEADVGETERSMA